MLEQIHHIACQLPAQLGQAPGRLQIDIQNQHVGKIADDPLNLAHQRRSPERRDIEAKSLVSRLGAKGRCKHPHHQGRQRYSAFAGETL